MFLRKFTKPPMIIGIAGCLTFALTVRAQVSVTEGIITPVAGGSVSDGGPVTSAELDGSGGVALDGSGNLHIADFAHDSGRRLMVSEPLPFSINDSGGLSITSAGDSDSVVVGYARVEPDVAVTTPTGNIFDSTPAGFAIFGFRQNGVLISEASVPASPLIQGGRIYAEVVVPVNTGLAIANPNDVAATINFFFADSTGTAFGSNSFSLGANEQMAAFLDQDPFNAGRSVQGTFTFTSSVPISVIALRGLTNLRNEFLMTTLPVASLTPAADDTVYLPRFVDGLGWTTQVILVNTTDETISGTVHFLGAGSEATAAGPVTLRLTDGRIGSLFAYEIPARGSGRIQTSNPATLSEGSVRVVRNPSSSSASALVILSGATGHTRFTEAGVPASPARTAFRMYAEGSGTPGSIGSIRSGLGISNTSSTPGTVNFELRTLDGTFTGLTASETVPGSGHIAKFVDELFPTLATPFQGILRVTSGSTPLGVVGLRLRTNERGEFLLTTTSLTDEGGTTTDDVLLFPHLVEGQGWTTQFILFSGVAGQSSSGTLGFFSKNGERLRLGLQ